MQNSTRSTGQVKSVGTLVADLALRTLGAERKFVRAGWGDEDGFLAACSKHSVTPARFADRRLGYICWFLCHCAETNTHPSESACLALAERTYPSEEEQPGAKKLTPVEWRRKFPAIDLDRYDKQWLSRLIGEIDGELSSIDTLGELVAQLAGYREGAARAHLRGLAELCIDLDRFTVRIEEKSSREFSPQRIKPRRRDRALGIAI